MAARVPLLFIHGIKGSALRDRDTRQRRYITSGQVLGCGSADLSLPTEWHEAKDCAENEYGFVQARDSLEAFEPLSSVKAGPITLATIYAPLLDLCNSLGRPFRAFAYDWRRDNAESVRGLEQAIRELSGAHDDAKVQVIAHSMGGLITLATLNNKRVTHLVHSVLYAGVPFGPGAGFLQDLHCGTKLGVSSAALSPAVLATFATTMSFFASTSEEQAHERTMLLEADAETRIEFDFYSVDDWEKQRLGIFAEQVSADLRKHFEHALACAKTFRQRLHYDDTVAYPPSSVLCSDAHPTHVCFVKGGPHASRGWSTLDAKPEDGDGRVRFCSVTPPYPHHELRKTVKCPDHSLLLNDTELVTDMLSTLLAL